MIGLQIVGMLQRIKLAGMVVVVCWLGMGYVLFVKPNVKNYQQSQQNEQRLKQQLDLKQREVAMLPIYRHQLNELHRQLNRMMSQLPKQHEFPMLLDDLTTQGMLSGLRFESLTPMPEVRREVYVELPITVIVTGQYHQLALFLSRVAHMTRLVTCHDFRIERVKHAKAYLRMTLTAKIYRRLV